MAGEETKYWTFHHMGLIVEDVAKAVEYFQALGFIDFLPEPEAGENRPTWVEIVAYGETVLKDGQPLFPVRPGMKPGRIQFCRMGTVPLELIQPGDAFKEVNSDFLKSKGEGVDHIAFTVPAAHFDQEVEKMKSRGLTILFSGRQSDGGAFTYFDTRQVGGIITELMKVPG